MSKWFLSIFALTLTFTASAEPRNLSLLKQEVRYYYDSGSYQQELAQAINKAHRYILQRAQNNVKHQKLALVLDIDETSLSNYSAIISQDFGFNKINFHKHVLAANATAIMPTLKLYKDAQKNNIAVFFITGRTQDENQATKDNLMLTGYNHWNKIYFRPKNYQRASIAAFKTQMRQKIINQGYVIIASIGDQQSDLKGGYAEKTFKLPNPFYYLP